MKNHTIKSLIKCLAENLRVASVSAKQAVKFKMKYIILAILPILLSSCMVVPFPHTAVPHSNIFGQVVDAHSGKPIKDIQVSLDFAGKRLITDNSGRFEFKARKEWYFFVCLSLLPIDQPIHNDRLDFFDYDNK